MSTRGYEWTHAEDIYYDTFSGQVKGEIKCERNNMHVAYGYGIAREDELIGRYVNQNIAKIAIEEAVSAWDGS
jgi:hypothetical protein